MFVLFETILFLTRWKYSRPTFNGAWILVIMVHKRSLNGQTDWWRVSLEEAGLHCLHGLNGVSSQIWHSRAISLGFRETSWHFTQKCLPNFPIDSTRIALCHVFFVAGLGCQAAVRTGGRASKTKTAGARENGGVSGDFGWVGECWSTPYIPIWGDATTSWRGGFKGVGEGLRVLTLRRWQKRWLMLHVKQLSKRRALSKRVPSG